MGLLNLSEFMLTMKELSEIGDLPLPVTDQEIISHFDRVTLRDFSICYPIVEEPILNDQNIIDMEEAKVKRYATYKIPKYVYDGTSIVNIANVTPINPSGYSDFYMPPFMNYSTPDAVIMAMADVRLGAEVSASLTKSPTIKYIPPDKCRVYNGWRNGNYEFTVHLKHPLSLATIEPGTEESLMELAVLDFKAFMYGKLKRKDNINTGVGELDLKISEWSECSRERKELIKEWRNETPIDFGHIIHF